MTPRRADALPFAPRLGAAILAMGLALAWAADARAGCLGRAHGAEEGRSAAAGLSPEVVGEPASPLKPAGCDGAFCSRPSQSDGMDFSGGVDLRAESWACCDSLVPPAAIAVGFAVAVSDDPPASPRPDALIEPPR